MNDRDLSPAEPPEATPTDELASALLDGEATPAELARAVEPEVAARLAAFEGAARLVAQPPEPPSDAARETAVAAALSAWDALAAAPTTAPTEPVGGTSGSVLRPGRWLLDRRLPLLGAAAALVAAVAVGGILLREDESPEDLATSAVEDATAGLSREAGAGAAAGGTSLALTEDLGAFDTIDALVAAARASVGGQGDDDGATAPGASAPTTAAASADAATSEAFGTVADAPAAAGGAAGCTPPSPEGTVVAATTATLDGRPVVVLVTDATDERGEAEVLVYDAATCEPVSD